MHNYDNRYIINRLTALWALSESGLGGVMHAMKIPFTGFFVGGFAVVLLALIAHYSGRNFRIVLQSTLLVILVKAAVSPQSPLPAYVAVAFQGFAGAVIFAAIPAFKPAAILFGFLALTESALQKFLVTTLIFGKSVWEAFDLFVSSLLKDLRLPADFSFSMLLIVTFTAVHALWGIILGYWSARIPKQLAEQSESVIARYNADPSHEVEAVLSHRKKNRWLPVLFVLIFIVMVFVMEGKMSRGIYVIARSLAVVLLVYALLKPLSWVLIRHAEGKYKASVAGLVAQLPALKNMVRPAYRIASASHKGISKYRAFIINLIILSLMQQEKQNDLPS